jgi:hypothetical protein
MATRQQMISGIESAVLTRSVRPEMDDLSRDEARALLRVGLGQEDLDRLRELVSRNQDDALTPEDKADLESYLRLSSLFDLMHAKARRTLKRHD